MKSALIAILLAVSSIAQTATPPAPTVAQLLGTWKLVSIEDTMKDGKVQTSPFGSHPRGFLMYQPEGYMCASIVNSDRPAWKDPDKATDAEKIAYYDTFIAYCGPYKLDGATSTVTHFPEIADAVLCRFYPATPVSSRRQPADHHCNTRSSQSGDAEAGAGVGAGEVNLYFGVASDGTIWAIGNGSNNVTLDARVANGR